MLNRNIFDAALKAYNNKDYQSALEGYYSCLKEGTHSLEPGESGLLYHNLGNCLLKMKNFDDATTAYSKALQDVAYDSKTSVSSNCGMALLKLGRNEEAVEQFVEVLKDPTYATPYKAYNGLGKAYMQLGNLAAAGTSYRNAAVDESNPSPVAALLNLGVCFMGMGRAQDAIDTYRAVFDFEPDNETLNKNYSNMGQAFVVLGDYPKAIEAFESALADGTFSLSSAALADYEKALNPNVVSQQDEVLAALDRSDNLDDPDGFLDDANFTDSLTSEETQASNLEGLQGENDLGAGIPSADSTGFFTATDEEIMGLTEAKKNRKRKKHRALKFVLVIIILLILALGAAAYLYYIGYGFPTQETVISELFDASQNDEDVLKYWVQTDDPEKEKEILSTMNCVTPVSNVEIDYLERSTISSDAIVTATLQEGGGKVRYSVSLSRDMLSWKVNGFSFAFPSAEDLAEATPYSNSGIVTGTPDSGATTATPNATTGT